MVSPSNADRRRVILAYPVDNAGFETTLEYRSGHLVPQKRNIARAAVELIGASDISYLDDGLLPPSSLRTWPPAAAR